MVYPLVYVRPARCLHRLLIIRTQRTDDWAVSIKPIPVRHGHGSGEGSRLTLLNPSLCDEMSHTTPNINPTKTEIRHVPTSLIASIFVGRVNKRLERVKDDYAM